MFVIFNVVDMTQNIADQFTFMVVLCSTTESRQRVQYAVYSLRYILLIYSSSTAATSHYICVPQGILLTHFCSKYLFILHQDLLHTMCLYRSVIMQMGFAWLFRILLHTHVFV